MTPAASHGYALVLRYYDGSGLIGVWGPYATEADAQAGQEALEKWPIEGGQWDIKPLLTPLGA